jgi:hypothetical protein
VAAKPTAEPFPVGARVASDRWGPGTVQRYDGDQVTVLFDQHSCSTNTVTATLSSRW